MQTKALIEQWIVYSRQNRSHAIVVSCELTSIVVSLKKSIPEKEAAAAISAFLAKVASGPRSRVGWKTALCYSQHSVTRRTSRLMSISLRVGSASDSSGGSKSFFRLCFPPFSPLGELHSVDL